VKERIVVAVLAFLFSLVSAYAQKTDFLELVKTGTPQSVEDAINNGADIKALDSLGRTPLMLAAESNPNPEVIIALLKAGADAKAKDKAGKTAFDYARSNYSLRVRGPDALKQLEEASK
jgi:hypothetical protein